MTCYEEYHTDPGHNGCGTMEEHLGPNWRYELERERRYGLVETAWRRYMEQQQEWLADNDILSMTEEEYLATPLGARGQRYIGWFRNNRKWG